MYLVTMCCGLNPKHAYELEITIPANQQRGEQRGYAKVLANTRTQAAAAIRSAQMVVNSVNMVG